MTSKIPSAFRPVPSCTVVNVPSGSTKGTKNLPPPPSDDDNDPSGSSTPETKSPNLFVQKDDQTFDWHSQSTNDEQRQLLGMEEDSSELVSSENEDDSVTKSVWNITKEQLNYYTTQFFSMQPKPTGTIPGAKAKEFFEKSRLPIAILRKIWQLSDVTQDGCLSLEEFLTAMHLVVLRRNEINLPDELPVCLQPVNLRNRVLVDTTRQRLHLHNKDLYGNDQPSEPLLDVVDGDQNLSPSSKPVNFRFHRQDSLKMDPSIAQPIALHITPVSSDEDGNVSSGSLQSQSLCQVSIPPPPSISLKRDRHREVVYEQLCDQDESSRRLRDESVECSVVDNQSASEEDVDDTTLKHQPISLPYFNSALRIPPNTLGLSKKEGAPPPPPRTHTRSSSLDLNARLPPALPPRFLVRRETMADTTTTSQKITDPKILSRYIHECREKNNIIARTINELHQEVSDSLEERIALEYQLEQLKSFGE